MLKPSCQMWYISPMPGYPVAFCMSIFQRQWELAHLLSMRYGGGLVDGFPTVMLNCAPAGATSTGTMRCALLLELYTRSPKSPAMSICTTEHASQ